MAPDSQMINRLSAETVRAPLPLNLVLWGAQPALLLAVLGDKGSSAAASIGQQAEPLAYSGLRRD